MTDAPNLAQDDSDFHFNIIDEREKQVSIPVVPEPPSFKAKKQAKQQKKYKKADTEHKAEVELPAQPVQVKPKILTFGEKQPEQQEKPKKHKLSRDYIVSEIARIDKLIEQGKSEEAGSVLKQLKVLLESKKKYSKYREMFKWDLKRLETAIQLLEL